MSTHAPRPEAALSAKGMRFALCATRWNVEIVEQLLALAMEAATSPRALAVAFGVLTCETAAQALERADPGQLDKGGEAALACLDQVHALRRAEPSEPAARRGGG